jgi:parallel beta-helix repeat protein
MVSRILLGTLLCAGGLVNGLTAGMGPVFGADPQPSTVAASPSAGAIAQQSTGDRTSYAVLYVNASAGSDQYGDGSQMRPLRTITHALRVAQPNTVIVLVPGVYSEQTGEQFPLQLRPGVTIQGAPGPNVAAVVIQGNSPYTTPSQGLRNITLLGADRAGLANVTVNNPHPNGHGLWIEAGSPVIVHNAFVGSGATGIYVAGAGSPVIQGNLFLENGEAGLIINGPSSAQVQGNVFENTGTGIQVAPLATPQILENRITRNQDGLVLHAEAQPVLANNQISDNRRNSVLDYAPWPNGAVDPALVAALPSAHPLAAGDRPAATPTPTATVSRPESRPPAAQPPASTVPEEPVAITAPPSSSPLPQTATLPEPETSPAAVPEGAASSPEAAPTPAAEVPAAEEVAPTPAADAAVAVPPPVTPVEPDAVPIPVAPNPEAVAARPEPGEQDAAALRERILASQAARLATVSNDVVGEDAIALTVVPPPAEALPDTPEDAPPTVATGPSLPPVPEQTTAPLPTPSVAPQGPISSNILIVPSATIPIGNGSSTGNIALANPPTAGGPPPPPSRASSLGLYYRVFVDANDDTTRAALRELVPDTFRVQVNGRPMMQAGAFDTLAEAQRTADWLNRSGFRAQVEYIP